MSAAQIQKLELLLDRVKRRAAEARPTADLRAVSAPVAQPGRQRPSMIAPPVEDISDAAEYIEEIEEEVESSAILAPEPTETEDEMVVAVSSREVVETDDASAPDVSSRGSGRIPVVATSETHVRAAADASASAGVLEVADESAPDLAEASGERDEEALRHSTPPESGSHRAAAVEESPDPSGQWGQVNSAEDTGVRSSARVSTRPSAPPASARQPSIAPIAPASGKHPSIPAPAALTPPESAPTSLSPVTTTVRLTGVVAASQGTLPQYSASPFEALLDASLDL